MTSAARLQGFLDDCTAVARPGADPSDIVQEIAPLMLRLLAGGADFLRPEHFHADPAHYARNLVHAAADDSLSLFTLVWLPGQMTPVHDHGTWGVVGVVEGVLMEQSYMRLDPEPHARRDSGIELRRGGLSLLTSGTVSTFVPNPDHIHVTGVKDDWQRAISLHLYGRMLSDFHIYDTAAGTRSLIHAKHTET
jgi:predicted metal-dependent enzyme (double-stranded beta helix superfamily)